jgi:hypothetical protein
LPSSAPDPQLVQQIADTLGTDPGLIEKDWHVVRALKTLAALDLGEARLVFTGGTCLSKAWGLIQRFSEDVDFKAVVPESYSRSQRRELRKAVEASLLDVGFLLAAAPKVGDEGRFFIIYLDYGSAFPTLNGLRSHIQVEVSLRTPKLPAIARSVQSFVAQAGRSAAEVAAIDCADPVETAAEKLSALAWRVLSHERGGVGEDPSMIRHLHDLAALETRAAAAASFAALARDIASLDSGRGSAGRPQEFNALLRAMLADLTAKPHWRTDYEMYIRAVSYAPDTQTILFDSALAALTRLIAGLTAGPA